LEEGFFVWRFRHHFPRRLIVFLLSALILFLVIQSFLLAERMLRPAILSAATIKADLMATDAINQAILEKVARNILYSDLINLEKDATGRILMAQLNTMEVNRLLAETTLATSETVNTLEKEPIYLPLGEVFGSYLFAAYGPRIPIRLIPMGRVTTNILDVFEEAGINQTRHKIYLVVHTEIRIIVPFISKPVRVTTTVPIADNVYIGEVPDTVINLQLPSLE
jgi:sporulation protein YunB